MINFFKCPFGEYDEPYDEDTGKAEQVYFCYHPKNPSTRCPLDNKYAGEEAECPFLHMPTLFVPLERRGVQQEKFHRELLEAIKSGIEEDWVHDERAFEIPVKKFNAEWALKQVLEVIEKHLNYGANNSTGTDGKASRL